MMISHEWVAIIAIDESGNFSDHKNSWFSHSSGLNFVKKVATFKKEAALFASKVLACSVKKKFKSHWFLNFRIVVRSCNNSYLHYSLHYSSNFLALCKKYYLQISLWMTFQICPTSNYKLMLLSVVQKRITASSSSDNAITTSINDFFWNGHSRVFPRLHW